VYHLDGPVCPQTKCGFASEILKMKARVGVNTDTKQQVITEEPMEEYNQLDEQPSLTSKLLNNKCGISSKILGMKAHVGVKTGAIGDEWEDRNDG